MTDRSLSYPPPPTEEASPDDTVEAHYASLERLQAPHVCLDGFVFVGHMVEDPETGDDLEVYEAVPCRLCSGEDR